MCVCVCVCVKNKLNLVQVLPRSKQYFYIIRTIRFKGIIAVCCDNHIKRIRTCTVWGKYRVC
jgi:hypothetical protein